MNARLKSLLPPALLLFAVFGSAMLLFLELEPFVLFNTDDWQSISIQRKMMPMPGSWNPARVFPELLMPLCSNVAAYVIMPFTGDYVAAFTVECALVYSLFIVGYVGLFFVLVRKRFAAATATAVFVSILFYLMHFIVLAGGVHLFQSDSVINMFYYSLSGLLCCSLVLYLMLDDVLDGFFSDRHVVKKGIFVVLLYLALISNLYASIVIATYIGIDLILRLIKVARKKGQLKTFFMQSVPKLIVLAFWGIVQVLEATGGRADSLTEETSFPERLTSSVSYFLGAHYDLLFLGLAVIIVIGYLIMAIRHNRETIADPRARIMGVAALAGVLTLIYFILVCAQSKPVYMQRTDVLLSFFFYVITVVLLCLVMLVSRYPRISLMIPFVILFVFFYIHPSVDTKVYGLTAETREAMTRDIVAQVKDGAESGAEVVEIRVPIFTSEDNWPLSIHSYTEDAFSRSLYYHGVIDAPVIIEMVPDLAMNDKYGIPYPQETANQAN